MSESEDDWVDSEDESPPMTTPVLNTSFDTIDSMIIGQQTHLWQSRLTSSIVLENFDQQDGSLVVNRCEPVKGNYPTFSFPTTYQQYNRVLLTTVLFHPGCEYVQVRFPDLKDKYSLHRSHNGLWVDPSANDSFRMKKKATDKATYMDTAFRLGADFKFHTSGLEPCFVFIATPFQNGAFLTNKTIRSKSFFVRSKRQDRYTGGPHKKRKKEKEVQKINTDIQAARSEKEVLVQQERRLRYLTSVNRHFLRQLRLKSELLPDGPVKIALMHATRPVESTEMVSL